MDISGLVQMVFLGMPYLLGLVIGAAIAIMGWSRAPKAAMAVLAGVAIAAMGWFCDPFLARLFSSMTTDGRTHQIIWSFFAFFSNVAQGAGIVFICLAAFLDRHAPSPLDKPQ